MMMKDTLKPTLKIVPILVYLLAASTFPLVSHSADKEAKPFAEQRLILQVSDADPAKYTAALDIANNLIKHYQGPDFVDIEVIAFGKGVEIYFGPENKNSARISSLKNNGVRFYVCLNTIDSIQRSTGKRPVLLDGVEGVQTGVAFMLEEIQAGYTHIHP
jgi:intracellular sulfur oxidation DsrE/DsrF family protein